MRRSLPPPGRVLVSLARRADLRAHPQLVEALLTHAPEHVVANPTVEDGPVRRALGLAHPRVRLGPLHHAHLARVSSLVTEDVERLSVHEQQPPVVLALATRADLSARAYDRLAHRAHAWRAGSYGADLAHNLLENALAGGARDLDTLEALIDLVPWPAAVYYAARLELRDRFVDLVSHPALAKYPGAERSTWSRLSLLTRARLVEALSWGLDVAPELVADPESAYGLEILRVVVANSTRLHDPALQCAGLGLAAVRDGTANLVSFAGQTVSDALSNPFTRRDTLEAIVETLTYATVRYAREQQIAMLENFARRRLASPLVEIADAPASITRAAELETALGWVVHHLTPSAASVSGEIAIRRRDALARFAEPWAPALPNRGLLGVQSQLGEFRALERAPAAAQIPHEFVDGALGVLRRESDTVAEAHYVLYSDDEREAALTKLVNETDHATLARVTAPETVSLIAALEHGWDGTDAELVATALSLTSPPTPTH